MTTPCAFTNGEVGNATFATGYAGAGNITIRGGAIDNGPRRTAGLSTEAIGFAHAENILLIPGTGSLAHLEENTAVRDIVLSAEDVAELENR